MNSHTVAEIQQLILVMVNCYLACIMMIEIRDLKREGFSYWHIIVNRIKYFIKRDPIYNNSYLWLKKHKQYPAYSVIMIFSVIQVYMLLHQFGTGEVYTKSKGWFYTGTAKGLSVIFLVIHYRDTIKSYAKRLKMAYSTIKQQEKEIAELKETINK